MDSNCLRKSEHFTEHVGEKLPLKRFHFFQTEIRSVFRVKNNKNGGSKCKVWHTDCKKHYINMIHVVQRRFREIIDWYNVTLS